MPSPSRRGASQVANTPKSGTGSNGQPNPPEAAGQPYTVVARRYRPQRFEEVVGQDHVVRALRNAIRMNRIAQAYLFCGTRGVGKTTMARIFAKCLNCVKGPTDEPCQVCDICQAIALGQDVDVIEIDGASNNGVEQVRELRQNAGLRPSRSRFKVYYIDEVHMLSTGAFNALLKTLEEPPPHVKFFFATTEANKIPDTVLSRCQRYDLAGIAPQMIAKTLGEICEHEGVEADPEALHVVARRAAGSLRDAESLLDRLLASGSGRLTVEVVQGLLGTASDERLLDLLEAIADHDAAGTLRLLDQASDQGVQPSEILGGLLDFLRDAMVLALGADSILLAVTPRQKPRLQKLIERFPIDSILTALQILDQHRTRLRGSLHGRLLVEMALVRVARLEDLESLDALIDRLASIEGGNPPSRRVEGQAAKKKGLAAEVEGRAAVNGPTPAPGASELAANGGGVPVEPIVTRELSVSGDPVNLPSPGAVVDGAASLDFEAVRRRWSEALPKVPATLRWRLTQVEPLHLQPPDVLVVGPKPGASGIEAICPSDAEEAIGP
ncbi:MAG: DNA polymerase III subunit gamma/tau, partial [Isosphaeraceae bacterium]